MNITEYIDAPLSADDTVFTALLHDGSTVDVVYRDAVGVPRRTQRRRSLKVARLVAGAESFARFSRTW
jgi:hypothetical protein